VRAKVVHAIQHRRVEVVQQALAKISREATVVIGAASLGFEKPLQGFRRISGDDRNVALGLGRYRIQEKSY
jgi:hypothetical protein